MRATRFSLTTVRRGHPPTRAALRGGVEDVSDFLVAHVADLVARAKSGLAADATFTDTTSERHFEDLRDGTDAEFVAAATVLSQQLYKEMMPVAARDGLLICATFAHEGTGEKISAALKLQVVSDQGAILEKLESGEYELTAVHDVLDRPGELQKGLVYPDDRPTSSAVVGDKANAREARYFLRAMGVVLEERSQKGLGVLAEIVESRLGQSAAERAIARLPTLDSGPVKDLLEALSEEEPSLTQELREEVLDSLSMAERPVVRVDTKAPLKTTIRSGQVRITGPAEDLQSATMEPALDGGWTITLRVREKPQRTYHS